MKRTWKAVVGFEGMYEVSDQGGRVKSMPRIRRNRYGLCNPIGNQLLKTQTSPKGYKFVRLYSNNGRHRDMGVHRLVLEAFVGPCPEGMQCCHNDGDPGNNDLSNLRWDTPRGNMDDREKHGKTGRGSTSGRAKLTEKDIPIIRSLKSDKWGAMSAVARRFGVDAATVRDIWVGRTWNHVH